ncbi:MAG: hypothetical protein WC859_00140 [Elusimicrobiota bacterium]|jgi:hypothetical protein
MRRSVQGLMAAGLAAGFVFTAGHFHWFSGWHLKPTYASAQVSESLKRMCLKNYHLSVQVHRQGDTLQVFFWKIGLLKPKSFEMRAETAESLEKVLLCATRVALSTDAPLKFIEVKAADVLSGASITLWRYVPDIRDSMFTRFGDEEFMNRLVMDITTERERDEMGAEHSWRPPITLATFLAKQVILRARRQCQVVFVAHEDLSQRATLAVVVDNWSTIAKRTPREKAALTDVIEKTAKTVLHGYRFSGFHGVVLKDGQGVALRSWTL